MQLQRIVLIGTAALALVFSAGVTAGKGGGGGGQGGMGGMSGMGGTGSGTGTDVTETTTEDKYRHREQKGAAEQKGELVRERNEGQPEGDAKGSGGGKKGKD